MCNGNVRSYLILEMVDELFKKKGVSGYIKTEMIHGRGRKHVVIYNLYPVAAQFIYHLYLVHSKEGHNEILNIRKLKPTNGSVDMKLPFDINNAFNSGKSEGYYNGAAVFMEGPKGDIKCIMGACKGYQPDWQLLPRLLKKSSDTIDKVSNDSVEDNIIENSRDDKRQESGDSIKNDNNNDSCNDKSDENIKENFYDKDYDDGNDKNHDNRYENCEDVGDDTGDDNKGSIVNDKNDLETLFKSYLINISPFDSKRRDYKWWEVSSPVFLSNILYQAGIRTPMLFNPPLMTAYYTFRHLIAGIYKDSYNDRTLMVCGIPGENKEEERPFGEYCKWVKTAEGYKKSEGYWLVFLEPDTGKILKLK